MAEAMAPLVLTLKLDQTTFEYFDRLRQQYFPAERNFLPAHVTLFHALPGEREDRIKRVLQQVCKPASQLTLTFPGVRFLGQGVAVEVECPDLLRLRQHLADGWQEWLSRQDRQGYRPHITIQNKVAADEARQLYERLAGEWRSLSGAGEGLLLWYYRGGPWELVQEFPFEG